MPEVGADKQTTEDGEPAKTPAVVALLPPVSYWALFSGAGLLDVLLL